MATKQWRSRPIREGSHWCNGRRNGFLGLTEGTAILDVFRPYLILTRICARRAIASQQKDFYPFAVAVQIWIQLKRLIQGAGSTTETEDDSRRTRSAGFLTALFSVHRLFSHEKRLLVEFVGLHTKRWVHESPHPRKRSNLLEKEQTWALRVITLHPQRFIFLIAFRGMKGSELATTIRIVRRNFFDWI